MVLRRTSQRSELKAKPTSQTPAPEKVTTQISDSWERTKFKPNYPISYTTSGKPQCTMSNCVAYNVVVRNGLQGSTTMAQQCSTILPAPAIRQYSQHCPSRVTTGQHQCTWTIAGATPLSSRGVCMGRTTFVQLWRALASKELLVTTCEGLCIVATDRPMNGAPQCA